MEFGTREDRESILGVLPEVMRFVCSLTLWSTRLDLQSAGNPFLLDLFLVRNPTLVFSSVSLQ